MVNIVDIPYCPSRPTHSIKIKKTMNIMVINALLMPKKKGTVNKVGDKISEIMLIACETLLALKNIHAKTVRIKVINIKEVSFSVGRSLPCATVSKLFRLFLVNKRGKI